MTLKEAITVTGRDITSIYNLDTDKYVYNPVCKKIITDEEMELTVESIFADCGINIEVRNN